MTHPKLRLLEFIPIEEDDEEWFFVRDPQGFSPVARLPREWGPLLARLDGQHSVNDILRACGLDEEDGAHDWLLQLLGDLDELLLLDSPRLRDHQQTLMDEFHAAPVRAAELAGSSYPASPEKLRAALRGYFAQAELLGAPQPCYPPENLRGIIVPHIDFQRGGAVEALAYERLRQAEFDLLICLGIAHLGVEFPFCLATKDFATPLGTQLADRDFIAALQEKIGSQLTAEQWQHKNEHSVEFVAVFLQACDELKSARFVPIICGGFFEELRSGDSPAGNADLKVLATALRELVEQRRAAGQRVGFIASVDLAHVGPNFNHPYPVTPARKIAIEKADREMLKFIANGDAEGFHNALATDANARHVDAHPAVYTLLHAFPELRAQLLHYAQAPAPEESMVSFAALAFYEATSD